MNKKLNFFATCAKNITPLLAKELSDLGAIKIKESTLGVYFSGGLALAYRVCLWSRLAHRVLLQLAICNAEDALALYEGIKKIDWQDHLRVTDSFVVDFLGTSTIINNSLFGAQRVKDAIADYFIDHCGLRPSVNKVQPDLRINVHLHDEFATVSLDLAGESLHRRGYRQISGIAPLKETLAAAILYRSNWPQFCFQKPLFDPMCGSGTILIEAAMMAQDCAPGIFREKFGFSHWLNHDAMLWKDLQNEARERRLQGMRNFASTVIWGSDSDAKIVDLANEFMERAGFGDAIKIEKRDVDTIMPRFHTLNRPGLIIANPPYGKRMQGKHGEDLTTLYRCLGKQLREHFIGWEVAIFTGNPELCKNLYLRPQRQYNFFNGTIPCKLILFNIREDNFWHECQ